MKMSIYTPSTDKRFLSRTQPNDKSTAGRFDPKVFVTWVQESFIIQLCLAQESLISGITYATMSLYNIIYTPVDTCMHCFTYTFTYTCIHLHVHTHPSAHTHVHCTYLPWHRLCLSPYSKKMKHWALCFRCINYWSRATSKSSG